MPECSLVAMADSVLGATTGELDVVGHSMGGRVAFEIVRAAPARVRSLALLDTAAHPAGVDEPAQAGQSLLKAGFARCHSPKCSLF